MKKGNVTITASKYDKKATINVIVLDILPEKISFKDKDITIMVGDNRKLDYELKPANVTDKKVIWEISDNSIIKNNNGVITALVVGTALVKIKTVNGYEDTCTIHVINRDIPLEKIKIVKPTETLYVNETIRINTIIIPSNATNKTLKWSSSNNEIATVENGVVKALKKGTVTIKVYDSEEKIYDQIDLEVLKPIINVLPNEITIIGDSRMVGLCGYKWYKEESGTCIAKTSMGYNWLIDTALSEVNKLSDNKKKNIVVNLGVNDLGHIDKYIDKYRELSNGLWKNYHIFLLSVNPTKGKRDDLNSRIVTFNNKLKDGLKGYANVTYCDSYSYLKNNGFESGDGLHYKETTSKTIYEQIKKCIYDYYNE